MKLTDIYFFKGMEYCRLNNRIHYRIYEIAIFTLFFFFFYVLIPFCLLWYLGVLLYRYRVFYKLKILISKMVKNDLNSTSKINRFKRKMIRIIYSFIMLIALFLSIALIIPMFIEIPIMLGYINERNKHIIKTKKLEISKEFSKKEKDENILSHVKLSK